jgi:hypothetical protein
MGWESILLERPVITFGEVFYNSFPLVVKAGHVAKPDWPNLIANTIVSWRPDRELLLKFIAAVLAGTSGASVVLDNPRVRPAVLDTSNVERITSLFAEGIKATTKR